MSTQPGSATTAPRTAGSIAAEFGAAWRTRTTRGEILMGDFYGGRPVILKYMPWTGPILEAGCGLGRYVFYLRKLGYDARGVEISEEALEECRRHASRTGEPEDLFQSGDVRGLDPERFPTGSLAGYLSLGVVEHFIEGPQAAFAEAGRLLAPGGVALFCTPNRWSLEHLEDVSRGAARRTVRRALAPMGLTRPPAPRSFDQYWFGAGQLARFARGAGFTVTARQTLDIKYGAHEVLKNHAVALTPRGRSRLFRVLDALERTPARLFGSLAFIAAIKEGPGRRCFFCGGERVPGGPLTWSVPVCMPCVGSLPREILSHYAPGVDAHFAAREEPGGAGAPLHDRGPAACWRCGSSFAADPDFGLFGFTRPACPECRRDPRARGTLALHGTLEQWRPRA
ncbi:MAG TPA: class I SAM-dependent methyltransferase [Candidatus Polarisedimenticolia bacterium]|jgi:SAM-dependent methyltransferase